MSRGKWPPWTPLGGLPSSTEMSICEQKYHGWSQLLWQLKSKGCLSVCQSCRIQSWRKEVSVELLEGGYEIFCCWIDWADCEICCRRIIVAREGEGDTIRAQLLGCRGEHSLGWNCRWLQSSSLKQSEEAASDNPPCLANWE